MRLIDADKLKIPSEEMIAKMAVAHAPSIDIVRCSECKHWYRAIDESRTIERFNFSECTKGHYGNGLEFYCADGERREP